MVAWLFYGSKAEYSRLHYWVEKELGKPKKCEHCGTTEARIYHWANKSHRYKKELTDWLRLCRKFHKSYDYPRIPIKDFIFFKNNCLKLQSLQNIQKDTQPFLRI